MRNLCQCYKPKLHGYVLYIVAMHQEVVIHNRQCMLFSDFFDPQSSLLLLVLQSQTCAHKARVPA